MSRVRMYMDVCMSRANVCVFHECVCTWMHACLCRHIYIYIYIHTYIHTYIHVHICGSERIN